MQMIEARSGCRFRLPAWFAVVAGFAMGALSEVAAPPAIAGAPPGTPIDNVASGTGIDSATLEPIEVRSNLVRAIVGTSQAIVLDGSDTRTAPPGAHLTFAHHVANLGNVATTVRFSCATGAGSDFTLANPALLVDVNGDGIAGPGEPVLASGDSLTLGPGEAAELVAQCDVPAAAAGSSRAMLEVGASPTFGGPVLTATDTVLTPPPPTIAFYGDGSFAAPIRVSSANRPLYLQAVAPGCDLRPGVRDTLQLAIRSVLTGDVQNFRAIETAANSGVFRVEPYVATALVGALATTSPGVLQVRPDDEVVATLDGCGGTQVEARVFIEPRGVVFDAANGYPVAGARVALIDVTGAANGGDAGGPARVFLADGVTPAPADVLTDASGRYHFEWVAASTYRVDIAVPTGFGFPSALAPGAVAPGYVIDADGSYGRPFTIAAGGGPVRFDLPLDALGTATMFVEKSAGRPFAEPGDAVDYTVRIVNASTRAITAARLDDALPPGFAYVPGTARLDTRALADPSPGARVSFALGTLAPNATVELRYRARIGAGAAPGDAWNRAVASGDGASSNVAAAKVTVTGGVFADEAALLGTVYVDRNGDRRRGSDDPGMPGVRLYLDDGTFAISDGAGQYSFYGITPRTHALQVDATTLPPGARLLATSHRDAGSPGSRLVALQRGDLVRADFALAADSVTREAPAERRRLIAGDDELGRGVHRPLDTHDDPALPGDPRSRPPAGLVDEGRRMPLFGPAARQQGANLPGDAAPIVAPAASPAPPPTAQQPDPRESTSIGDAGAPPRGMDGGAQDIVERSLATDVGTGFIGLADGDTLDVDQITVRVRGRQDHALELSVNHVAIPATRVGRRVTLERRGAEAWEYVGVNLAPGPNLLELTERDAGGAATGHAAITVLAPGHFERIELLAPATVAADGHSDAVVRVRTLDAHGVPAACRSIVTLETTRGQWHTTDLDPASPGLQIAVVGGTAEARLTAPSEPGTATVRATAGGIHGDAPLEFVPELRPLLAVGSVEGMLAWNRARGFATRDLARTGFEQAFTSLVAGSDDGGLGGGARAALFLKGRLSRDVLVTLGYDSDRPANLRRLRDIQPDAFYPVYGDASVRGYEAQSTGRLYARLDRRGAALAYGDFVAQGASGAQSLTQYSRSLTGVQQHWESSRLRVDTFASRALAGERVEEFPGRGISGPYTLARAPIVENSERVEIVVRDRNQPSVIVTATARERFADYEIEPLTGRILFKEPVPAFDAALDPVSIRVSYSVEGGGDPVWVSGMETRLKLGGASEVGATLVDDRDPLHPYRLGGVFFGHRLDARSTFEAELAHSANSGAGGSAARFELRRDGADGDGRLFGSITDGGFVNPHAGFSPGHGEAGLRWNKRLDARTRLLADGVFSSDAAAATRHGGLLLGLDRSFGGSVHGEFGARIAGEHARPGPTDPTSLSLRSKLLAQLPWHPELSAYGEYERDVLGTGRELAALGAEYRLRAHGRLYVRHELASTLGSAFELSTSQRRLASVAGFDADLGPSTHVFSEYRIADALPAREAEAALGLRNTWQLDGGLRVTGAFERVHPLQGGDGTGPSTAVSGGIESTDADDVKASARMELRTSRASDNWLSSTAVAVRLDSSWSALGRNLATITDERAAGVTTRERMQLGLAFRPSDDAAFDALGRYELHLDREHPTPVTRSRRTAHVLSANVTGQMFDVVDVSFAYAAKRVFDRSDAIGSSGSAQWVHGHWSREFGATWDAGLNTSALFADGGRRDGLGVELGRSLANGLWLSAGWNRFGYSDPDLPDETYTRAGFYMRMRARLAPSLFDRLTRGTP